MFKAVSMYNINDAVTFQRFQHTCNMLRDLLMSPDDKVTVAFIPSGVMSMLLKKINRL